MESFTRKKPSAHRGDRLTFGPYKKEVDPFTSSPLEVHAENNSPFVALTSVEREVEVSHWGNVAVEEVYDMRHAGARLEGGFSRFDYQMQRHSRGPHFREVAALLPSHAEDVYYRDTIGNISTSALREEEEGALLLIRPRFPMFGGWRTTFYLGHNTPAKDFLFVDAEGRRVLRFDLPPYLRGAVTDDLTVKIVLPEGSTDVRVDHPLGDYHVEQSTSRRFTYLDSSFGGGRPVLVLHMKNVVDEHRQPVSVRAPLRSAPRVPCAPSSGPHVRLPPSPGFLPRLRLWAGARAPHACRRIPRLLRPGHCAGARAVRHRPARGAQGQGAVSPAGSARPSAAPTPAA